MVWRFLPARFCLGGALQHDREFALVDGAGQVVNAKRTAKMQLLRSTVDLAARTVSLRLPSHQSWESFHWDRDRPGLETWFSDYFGFPVHLVQNLEIGFPDDTDAPGPTVISTATLAAIADWFPDLSLEQLRLRFRANLEISGVPAFWEDQLFTEVGNTVQFAVGTVHFVGVNPCQRCVVPTRDPVTGKAYPGFQKTFVARRQLTLPPWVNESRFNHFFRLSVNTRIPGSEVGKVVRVGDRVTL
ncbi:MOSC domain-containing protein [Neosynechococcus sphagnicola]|uniref:MOSC domain-containing protein n=1 Tax=Neosynechococcus sphagnicola TaxID=1501145 RepID=UPI001EF9DDC3|nr:MOSC domain-containing protein [Neosynechococcus sphagnicola]